MTAKDSAKTTAKTTARKPTDPDETATVTPDSPEADVAPAQTPEANRDRVAAVSYRADGTPDQTPDFVRLIPDKQRRG